ncbi:MAG: TadE/TadG family type IV pilus assembly protein [Mycobacteriales bacterium]|nr:MAG: hypothetical protein DLM56_00545 [Pseudonocardiales bacterium]
MRSPCRDAPAGQPGLRARLARCRGDAGAGSLEFALITPAFLAITFLVIQAALAYEAQNMLNARAQSIGLTVRSCATYGDANCQSSAVPSSAQIDSAAQNIIHGYDNSGTVLTSTTGSAGLEGNDRVIRVQLTGQPIELLGFGVKERTAVNTGTYEGFRPAG